MPATARASNDTLAAFLNTLNDAGLQPGEKVRRLMGYFCPDAPNTNPPPKSFPCLGITDHGPAFLGVEEVTDFFAQLFQTFPDMQWRDLGPKLTAANEIGIQMEFAIFSFQEKTFKIQQLQIYLDRYAMMESIGLDWSPKGRAATSTQSVRTSAGRRVTITIED